MSEQAAQHELSYDTIFFTLSNARRRFVLHYLKQREEPISTGDLATQGAAWEYGIPCDQVTNQQRKRVYSALHQTHLPKMDQFGLLRYDKSRAMVYPTDIISELDFYLEVSPKNDLPWHEYFVALSTFSLVLVLAAWVDPFPFGRIPDLAYAAIIAVSFAVSSVAYARQAPRSRFGEGDLPPSLRRDRESTGTSPESR